MNNKQVDETTQEMVSQFHKLSPIKQVAFLDFLKLLNEGLTAQEAQEILDDYLRR